MVQVCLCLLACVTSKFRAVSDPPHSKHACQETQPRRWLSACRESPAKSWGLDRASPVGWGRVRGKTRPDYALLWKVP